MADSSLLYKNQVMLLSQTFFIKDNKTELLVCAHKYDFDILFFDQMSDFVKAAQSTDHHKLFVIDLDVLHNMQDDLQHSRKQTMFLSDLLQRLPDHRNYVYLQTVRQGERFLLQQKLVDSKCLAYADKPITNDMLIDKLFTLFAQQKRRERNVIVYLSEQAPFDESLLRAQQIEVLPCKEARLLHLLVKEELPDIVVIDEAQYQQTEALVRVLKKNIEFDPGCEIVMLQNRPDPALARRAFDSGFDEILMRTDCDLFTRQLINRIHKIRISKDLISRDRATGLLNKVGFQNKALETLRRAQKEDKPLAYGIIDIDKFKTINDTWGHYFGDIVIKRLSLVLSAQLGERDLLSRFGGEEFVVLFWDCDAADGRKKLDAMRLAFGDVAFTVTPNEQRHFSFSGGLANFPDCKTENELFLKADAQLYQAKQTGRNRICAAT
jgi:two-component system cell cycle response regulator